MKSRLFFLTLGLVAVLAASCAPRAVSTAAPVIPTSTSEVSQPVEIVPTSTQAAAPVETAVSVPTALPIATSRGPNLEATDPATVSLASGGLQLVEFFRFT